MIPRLLLLAAIKIVPEPIPDLKPPRGEIPPGLWEEQGTLILILAALGCVILAAVIQRWRTPRPVITPSPAEIARAQLDRLSAEAPADALAGSARILRAFIVEKCALPGPGLTADEIAASLTSVPEIAGQIYGFLGDCERAQFAPRAVAPPPEAAIDPEAAIEAARGFIDALERRTPPPIPG